MAERFPKPDVPQSIRKLPAPQPGMAVPSPIAVAARPAEPSSPEAHVPGPPAVAPAPPPRPAVVAPLAPERFKLQLTISRKTRERLEEARDLLGHQVPDGDLAEVVDRALDVLVRELRRKKYAETEAPRKPRLVEEKGATRHIPNHVKREVARRDGHQCTFVAENGQRCPARGKLEFHDIDPQAKGGAPTLSNVTLRCKAHNGYAAEADYGAEVVARSIAEARARAGEHGTRPGTRPGDSAGARAVRRDETAQLIRRRARRPPIRARIVALHHVEHPFPPRPDSRCRPEVVSGPWRAG